MASDNLFNQCCARTRHADNKDRQFGWISPVCRGCKRFTCKCVLYLGNSDRRWRPISFGLDQAICFQVSCECIIVTACFLENSAERKPGRDPFVVLLRWISEGGKKPFGLNNVANISPKFGEFKLRIVEIRVDLQRFPVAGLRFTKLAQRHLGVPQNQPDLRVARCKRQHPVARRLGSGDVAALPAPQSQPVKSTRLIRGKLHGALQKAQRLLMTILGTQREAKLRQALDMVRIDLECLLKRDTRIVIKAKPQKSYAEMKPGFQRVRREQRSPRERISRRFCLVQF